MGNELFVEIGCEEIPARFLEKALSDFSRLTCELLDELGLTYGQTKSAGTPRRLALSIADVLERQTDKDIQKTGPAKQVAFDPNGNPTKAAMGFAKGQGVDINDLQIISTDKGEYIAIQKFIPGRDTADLLSERLGDIILSLPWPKSMKWNTLSTRFVRPVHWIAVLLGDQVIPFELFGLQTGNITYGHRFMAPDPIEIQNFNQYIDVLRSSNVIALIEERRQIITDELARIGRESDVQVVSDNWLVEHVANLVEFPVALSGTFDEQYLALPREVLVTTMRDHQKYFVIEDENKKLLSKFVTISNMLVPDPNVVIKGNERVLTARLEDAKFYFNEDQKKSLENFTQDLTGVLYQANLGTYAEKTDRNLRLVQFLAEKLAPERTETALRAAYLAKADLVSGMIGEFPELQGIMGMYYARHHNEPEEVAVAIREHYLPKGQSDELPQTITGALVSLADKFDTICGCFGVGLAPTGSGDPFALRRSALGIINILIYKNWVLDLPGAVEFALQGEMDKIKAKNAQVDSVKLHAKIIEFFRQRLAFMLKGIGLPTATVDAVLSVNFYDIVEAKKRAEAVASFAEQEQFEPFAIAFKRAANILTTSKDDYHESGIDSSLFEHEAEHALLKAVQSVEKEVSGRVKNQDHLGALTTIAQIRPEVDTFFDDVLVMHEDEKVRINRLALLARIGELFSNIADFKKL